MTTLSPARTCTLGLFTSSPKVTPSSSSDAAVNSTRGAQHDIVASAQVVEQIVMAGMQVESAAKFGSLLCRGAI